MSSKKKSECFYLYFLSEYKSRCENKKLFLKEDNYETDSSQWVIMEEFTKHGLKKGSQESYFSHMSFTTEDMPTSFQHTLFSLHETFNAKEKSCECKKHKNAYGQDSQLTTYQESQTGKKKKNLTIKNIGRPLVGLQNLVYII